MNTPIRRDGVKQGVLLMSHGAARDESDVERWLTRVRGGRVPSAMEVERSIEKLRRIGGSPLQAVTLQQVDRVRERLGCPVYHGALFQEPTIEEAIQLAKADGIDCLVAAALVPHFSEAGSGRYFRTADASAAAAGVELRMLREWWDHPQLTRAWVLRLQQAGACDVSAGRHVLYVAHSLPAGPDQAAGGYAHTLLRHAERISAAAGIVDWTLAWQSEPPGVQGWLQPTVHTMVRQLAALGGSAVVVCPIGFISDNLEVLYDLDVVLQGQVAALGMTYRRCASLNADDALIEALCHHILTLWKE